MNVRLSLIIDNTVPSEIYSSFVALESKGISVWGSEAFSQMADSGKIFCLITNQPHKWKLDKTGNLAQDELLIACFKSHSLLAAKKINSKNTQSTDFALSVYGQILWLLFTREYEQISKGRISAFLDLLSEGLLICSSDGIVLFFNQEIENITGWLLEEIVFKPIDKFVRFKHDIHQTSNFLAELKKDPRKVGSIDFLFRNGSWHTLFYHSFLVPEFYTGEDVIIIIAGTHSKAESEEVENRIDQIQQRAILHDFRNLLQGVVTYTDLLGFEIEPDSPAFGYLSKIRSELKRGQEILGQLMHPKPYDESVISLNQTVENLVNTLREILPSHIKLTFSSLCEEKVAISPVDLGRILRNLVKNSATAIGDVKGEIHITIGRFSTPDKSSESNDFVAVTVSDTGPGIPKQLQSKIFEPFFTTHQDRGGTGLGLYSVYSIVKQNGGRIYFESKPNKGTTFVIYLPKANK